MTKYSHNYVFEKYHVYPYDMRPINQIYLQNNLIINDEKRPSFIISMDGCTNEVVLDCVFSIQLENIKTILETYGHKCHEVVLLAGEKYLLFGELTHDILIKEKIIKVVDFVTFFGNKFVVPSVAPFGELVKAGILNPENRNTLIKHIKYRSNRLNLYMVKHRDIKKIINLQKYYPESRLIWENFDIMDFVKRNCIDIVKDILDNTNVDPSIYDNKALKFSLFHNRVKMTDLLISHPKCTDNDKDQHLVESLIRCGYYHSLYKLVNNKYIDLSAGNNKAMKTAIDTNNLECVKIILRDNRVDVFKSGFELLIRSTVNTNIPIFTCLLEHIEKTGVPSYIPVSIIKKSGIFVPYHFKLFLDSFDVKHDKSVRDDDK